MIHPSSFILPPSALSSACQSLTSNTARSIFFILHFPFLSPSSRAPFLLDSRAPLWYTLGPTGKKPQIHLTVERGKIFGRTTYDIITAVPAILWALTIHEFAHGWVAHKCGDDTALHAGRLTLNPLAHLDLFGTIAFIIMGFGWAKPVPVNPHNFRKPRRDDILVSLAGVTANLLSAVGFSLVLRVLLALPPTKLISMLQVVVLQSIFFNLVLLFFNLIPIPPLDGSHVLRELLPWDLRARYDEMRPYAPFMLLALIFLGRPLLNLLIWRPSQFLADLLLTGL